MGPANEPLPGFVRVEEYQRVLKQLDAALQLIEQLHQEINKLQKQTPPASAQLQQPYSVRGEEQRQQKRGKMLKESRKQRRGRLANEEKLQRAQRIEDVYPQGVPAERCKLSHVRLVWRYSHGSSGQAVLVAYRVFRLGKQFGQIPGVLGRSEWGLEIVVSLAQLVYVIGLSFGQACQTLGFLQNLQLSKSQADALLRQLAKAWEGEFEVLCTLLAHSLVVHTDETSWSLKSLWAFLSEKARLLIYGVPKDEATLKALLDPDTFGGLVFSDDYAVYAHFGHAQKCWAHLLRKAIKLALQDPLDPKHQAWVDGLLQIYRQAKQIQRDGRLSDAGRRRKVEALSDDLFDLCDPIWREGASPHTLQNDRCNLAIEILRLLDREELFTFVTAKPVEQPNGQKQPMGGTNNEAERTLRADAQARAAGQGNKTLQGARRSSILTSVLESLRLYVPRYTLSNVLAEVQRWREVGQSCFRQLLEKLALHAPERAVLEVLYPPPQPSG